MLISLAIIFGIGLVFGSFLNAYIFRFRHNTNDHENGDKEPQKLSVWQGRSYCPQCKKTLRWYELIPLVSFALQAGRCRGCRKKIDWQYPLVELSTAILFTMSFLRIAADSQQISNYQFPISNFGILLGIGNWELGISLSVVWYLLSVLIILFIYDLRFGLVPDRVVLPAIVIGFAYKMADLIRDPQFSIIHDSLFMILAIVLGAAFFAAQYYFSKGRWLGAGDIRIGALMGAMLGWPLIFVGITISYFIGGAVGIALLLSGRKKFGQTLPLGTFLTLGTAITFLFGNELWRIYWGL